MIDANCLATLINPSGTTRRRCPRGSSSLRRSSLFSLYAKIFRLLLSKWNGSGPSQVNEGSEVDEYTRQLESLVLPSNEDWRLRVYYRLVELQRESDALASDECEEMSMNDTDPSVTKSPARRKLDTSSISNKWDWEPNIRVPYPLTPRSSRRLDSDSISSASLVLEACIDPGWRLRDILLAAKLLTNQPQEQYTDEAEMRRVFGLVYDVLRYKHILDRALDDVDFWLHHANLKKQEKVVWLLLYDMQGRKFARLGSSTTIAMRNDALREAGLLEIEKALLDLKTRLAASLSRLRISGSALSLDELLPAHLRTAEGVTWGEEGAIASGWVNSAKLSSRRQFIEEMRKLGLNLCLSCSTANELEEDQYVFDPLCPKVVNLHEKAREKLAVSHLVKSHSFVFLERSLCVGAAALVQAIRAGRLCGPVILTHSLAPRHTGYLAELLADVEEAGRLLAFGLGDSRVQHQTYLERLGISLQQCKLFSERYTSAPPLPEVERATIVLATPPCSYTGVRDVVDLAIARGGDLTLLESLTSLEAESPQQPRTLLVEQMATLKYALTRPNVQLLVYEVHTLLPSETSEMIEQAVDHANQLALDKFQREHPQRTKSPPRDTTTKKSKCKRSQSIELAKTSQEDGESSTDADKKVPNHRQTYIPIPESDLFEMCDLNELYNRDCSKLVDQGSFIVVIKRKEMMQFNSLFMIKVAEAKGVFGEPNRPLKTPEPQQVRPTSQNAARGRRKKGRKKDKVQFERLTAPTHSSIARVLREKPPCPRHHKHLEHEEMTIEMQVREARRRDARRWWDELALLWRQGNYDRDYHFQAIRTDPITQKLLFPSHVMLVTYSDTSLAVP
ncbi:uncharacterized protein LOC131664006 isoform X2 [Phymastichus coffea]|uniref:uncharacterized protein LOC131664006 isoform X2 n=1 Tax=Phymastichus coffea TaxID=108790 RepID=UPI00273BEAAF|nr:uncharacterized protein LOC131664006 isoform X2 [Phymastichus coffea]